MSDETPEAPDLEIKRAQAQHQPLVPLVLPEGFGDTMIKEEPTPAVPVNLVRKAEQQIEVACMTWANTRGEDVDYAVGLNLLTNAQGQMVAVLGVFLSIKAVEVGHRIHASTIVDSPWGDQEFFDKLVRDLVQQLIAARTAQAQGVVAAGAPSV